MRLLPTIVVLALLPFTAACGTDDATTTGQDAADRAGELAVDLDGLAEQVEQEARKLADDPQASEDAKAQLEDAAERAEELAQQARDELPENEPSRAEITDAAERLQSSAESAAQDADGSDAADQAGEARERLRSAADELRDRVPEDVRSELEDVLGG
jgi:uncharacterized phage infection (PIP) family protein YhgE